MRIAVLPVHLRVLEVTIDLAIYSSSFYLLGLTQLRSKTSTIAVTVKDVFKQSRFNAIDFSVQPRKSYLLYRADSLQYIEFFVIITNNFLNQRESHISIINVKMNRGKFGDRMQQVLDKSDFQIILESEGVDESYYWKKQCKMLYDLIQKNLPEGSVDPLRQRGIEGEKDVIITSFAVLKFAGITYSSFHVLLKLINVWERNRKNANIKLKTQNGSEFNLSNISIEEALKIYKNIQHEDNRRE